MAIPFDGCEPEAAIVWKGSEPMTEIQAATISIAISLKRIADALTYVPAGEQNIYDMMNNIRHNTAPRSR